MSMFKKDQLNHDIKETERRAKAARSLIEWILNIPVKERSEVQISELSSARNTLVSFFEDLERMKKELDALLKKEAVE